MLFFAAHFCRIARCSDVTVATRKCRAMITPELKAFGQHFLCVRHSHPIVMPALVRGPRLGRAPTVWMAGRARP
jgi:hypothetical protein